MKAEIERIHIERYKHAEKIGYSHSITPEPASNWSLHTDLAGIPHLDMLLKRETCIVDGQPMLFPSFNCSVSSNIQESGDVGYIDVDGFAKVSIGLEEKGYDSHHPWISISAKRFSQDIMISNTDFPGIPDLTPEHESYCFLSNDKGISLYLDDEEVSMKALIAAYKLHGTPPDPWQPSYQVDTTGRIVYNGGDGPNIVMKDTE